MIQYKLKKMLNMKRIISNTEYRSKRLSIEHRAIPSIAKSLKKKNGTESSSLMV